MVATAQGKHGIWMFIFPDRENTRNFTRIINYVFIWEIYLHQTQYFEVLKSKGCTKVVVECCYNKDNMRYNPLAFVASFELEVIPVVG